ncbi:suppressor of fused domain protein [Tsukamurella pseudospumae]|uniref:Suppressor of fused protein (SUFU) n=1 Tax=Tsukamurella pseudospumae TaxID=239498 RepID=A0A138A0U4_9ACTN|nr:suppressor of fused domain protein [Tsukamurella pseudospumae]KXO88856.1 Suppressor of fused protein (SUFU) [Tsukamurella pseudospumae]KXP04061.1 Suppressor of fused protein (SUFU) [Tsukamurella pseudospumae]
MSSVVDAAREHLAAHYEKRGFAPPASASVTFLGLEPMTVQRWVGDRVVAFASVGCSRHAMTDPNALVTVDDGPRAEVVLELRPATDGPGAALDGVHRSLAILAATPAVEGLVLAPDALVDLGAPLWAGASFTAVLLGESTVPDLHREDGEPVRFLRADPITANEAAWVRLKGAEALREAWAEAGIDPADPGRPAARAV